MVSGNELWDSNTKLLKLALALVITLLAAVLAGLNTEHGLWPGPIAEYSLSYGELGELPHTSADSENVFGSLAIQAPMHGSEPERHVINGFSRIAKSFKRKLQHLSAIRKQLKADDLQVKAQENEERIKYRVELDAAKKSAKVRSKDSAAKVAQLAIDRIERQLKKQQDEISSIITKQPIQVPVYNHARSYSTSLYKQMVSYLKNTVKKSAAAILNMVDYNMKNDVDAGGQDPGIGAEPPVKPIGWKNSAVSWNSAPWENPSEKAGPCSVPGDCNHGRFIVRSPEYWNKLNSERFAWPAGDVGKPSDGLEMDNTTVQAEGKPKVSDEILLARPVGEAKVSSSVLSMSAAMPALQQAVEALPDKDLLLAGVAKISIGKHGLYSFCTPSSDGSLVFVDNDRVTEDCGSTPTQGSNQTVDPSSCGTVDLLTGSHLVRVVAFNGKNSPAFTVSYSGPDTQNSEQQISSTSGWVVRAYQSSQSSYEGWISVVCQQEKKYFLGDEEIMSDMDDFLPPNDAYIHDQLTSGSYEYDHFGKLAPMSKENQELMYGKSFVDNVKRIVGKELHSPGRGGAGRFTEPWSKLGDEQIGDDDREVPVKIANGVFPGEDHDHFGHWKWNSPLNQDLLNGMYWQHLKEDGMTDRLMPTAEAFEQRKGASHDSHSVADLAVGSWNIGSGPPAVDKRGEQRPAPWVKDRISTQGKNWGSRVFTGTYERIEGHQGVVGNNMQDGGSAGGFTNAFF